MNALTLLKKSNDYLLGRIHERASLIELEELVRLRLTLDKRIDGEAY